MGCEQGGCGHHRGEKEIQEFLSLKTHPRKLKISEVQARSIQKLPVFSRYNEYRKSDFFLENDNLGIGELQFQGENNSEEVWKLQRMLVILGYMQESDFFILHSELQGYDSDSYQNEPNGGVYMEGYFSQATKGAVEFYQENNALNPDGRVGVLTKEAIYKEMYESYYTPINSYISEIGEYRKIQVFLR